MRLKASTQKKLRYGGTSAALTALIMAAIIVINVIFSLCVERFSWYIDLTPDLHFTISEECFELLGAKADDDTLTPIEMLDKFRADNKAYNTEHSLTPDSEEYRDENVKVTILFGMESDQLIADEITNYVYRNAMEIQQRFPDYVSVECVDGKRNPSRFTKYLSSNTESIALDSVIVECGTEFRIRSLRSFYVFVDDETPYAYNGEKAFASSILAVTRAEAPLACYTVNHGEKFPSTVKEGADTAFVPFIATLQDAGYVAQPIDLSKEEIPEACRILIVFDPKQDFLNGKDGVTKESELDKLDAFLADRNSLFVFMNPDSYTGRLENFEEFLEEWGLGLKRDGNDPYLIRDPAQSIMGNSSAVVGSYMNNPLAQGWTEAMRSGASAPKVVFQNATALSYPTSYIPIEDTNEDGSKFMVHLNATYGRTVFDLFTTGEDAEAYAGDRNVASATSTEPFRLMSVSVETHTEQEYLSSLEDSAFVMLCGSTDFANDAYLTSNTYGNSDLLLSALQMAGREPVPVGLKFKEFANYEIDTVTTEAATQYTVVLTLVPILASLCAGVFVIVRRKNR